MRNGTPMVKGVFQRPVASDCWWINYYVDGKQHREKVGRKSDALALYQSAKPMRGVRSNFLNWCAARPSPSASFPRWLCNTPRCISPPPITTGPKTPSSKNPSARARPLRLRRKRSTSGSASTARQTPRPTDTGPFSLLPIALAWRMARFHQIPARLVRLRTENNARMRFLSRAEYAELLGIIQRDNPQQALAFILSVYTGMRWGEQFSLEWSQVDLKRKIIRLTKTKNGSARNVPLNAVALEALKQQREAVVYEAGDPVFPRPGPRSDCRWWFEPALREAKISEYTWHNNRHTFCSWLAMVGVSTSEIQVLAGHKTITMAARYAHLSPDATAAASEKLVSP